MTKEFENHPIKYISDFVKKKSDVKELEFGIYTYKPQTVEDRRDIFRVPVNDLNSWFTQAIATLQPNQDIALQSRIYSADNKMFHLPMIDFVGVLSKKDIGEVRSTLSAMGIDNFIVARSGRSYHLYGLALLSPSRLSEFFGRVLLLNKESEELSTDIRWVGHRLIAGYCALRWSCNNPHYMEYPKVVRESELPATK